MEKIASCGGKAIAKKTILIKFRDMKKTACAEYKPKTFSFFLFETLFLM